MRCNTPGEALEVVEARKTWFVPGARSAIPGHEVGLVRTCAGHGSSMKSLGHGSSPKIAGTPSHTQLALSNVHGSSMEVPGVWVMDQPQNSWWYGKLT